MEEKLLEQKRQRTELESTLRAKIEAVERAEAEVARLNSVLAQSQGSLEERAQALNSQLDHLNA